MKQRIQAFVFVALAAAVQGIGASAQRSSDAMSMGDFMTGRWPSRAAWSPDGRHVSFLSTDWSTQDLFVVPAGGGEPLAITRGDGFVGGPGWDGVSAFGSWSHDSRQIAFNVSGEIRVTDVGNHSTRVLGKASSDSEVHFSPIARSAAYVRDGDLVMVDVDTGEERALTHGAALGSSFSWSPDGRLVAAVMVDRGPRLSASPPFLGPQLSVSWSVGGRRRLTVIEPASRTVRPVAAEAGDDTALAWAPDSRTILVESRAPGFQERSLRLVDARGLYASREIYRQRDPKHLATNDQTAAFSPDGASVLFTSDESGWNHLYVASVAAAGAARPLTQGRHEISFPSWSNDGRSVSFASTQVAPSQRHLFRVPAAGGTAVRLTQEPGVNTAVIPSPDRSQLLFIHTDARRLPDYWTIAASANAAPRQLTRSMPSTARSDSWQSPRIVTFTSKGGMSVAAQLFLPIPFESGRAYPAIVQVHEASVANQHVFLGPGPQKNHVGWYGWHQRLAQRGYVVLNLDYRGSFGYGREFRTADYLVMGQDPLEDVIAGVDWLAGQGYVDRGRLGAVGLSAGGRMVLSLLAKYPDTFRAGVNLAGIYDYLLPGGPWDTRNPWTTSRLGTPDASPDVYRDASPKSYVDRIVAPLLVLHGTADANVPVTHSLALVEDLVARGKRFDFAVYPGEVHYFARRASWIDAFGRIEGFLDRHLRPSDAAARGVER